MEEVIFTDANELNLLLKGKAGRESFIFTNSQIQSISFTQGTSKILGFIPTKGRKITITCKLGTIEFDEGQHKKYFEHYLDILRKYCKDNRVTFHDFE